MKKIIIIISLFLGFGCADAQRFFYIDANPVTENLLKGELKSASQHISVSPLSSDYIVGTDIGFRRSESVLTMEINLKDSVTLQTIFQKKEVYTFREANLNSRLLLRTVIRAFIERNIPQIVLFASENHDFERMSSLKTRKDKT
jgi:hypothetical protein